KLKKVGLYLELNKYKFLVKRIKYLEFIINTKIGIAINLDKKVLTIVKSVQEFISFANFYRKFIFYFL
ncbi:hypothetical protein K505DRAFT_261836, partial [Melanomma pulvis-pyrius CBS 109.77]